MFVMNVSLVDLGQQPEVSFAKHVDERKMAGVLSMPIEQLDKKLRSNPSSLYSSTSYSSRVPKYNLKQLVEAGDLARVEVYLRCGASPNPKIVKHQESGEGGTWFPLQWAVTSGKVEMVQLLFDFGANVNAKGFGSREGLTALRLAVEQQKVAIVAKLLDAGACPESYQHHYGSAKARESRPSWEHCDIPVLYDAVTRKNLEIAEMLLRKGAKPNLPKSYKLNYSYLTEAVRGECPELVALLLQFGADVNFEVPRLGTTPLILAAMSSKYAIEMSKMLVQHGANIHAHELVHKCQDALAAAVSRQNFELVALLLQLGAKADAIDSKPLSVAVNSAGPSRVATQIVSLLLDHGAQVNDCDPNGEEPLFGAVRNQHRDMAEVLLKRGAVADIVHDDMTPLKQAVLNKQTEMVQLLLSYNASPSARVFAPSVLTRGSEVCCSALDLAHEHSTVPVLAILQSASRMREPEPSPQPIPAGDDEEKRPVPCRPRTPVAVSISREVVYAILKPIDISSDKPSIAYPDASRLEIQRTVGRAILHVSSAICQQAGRNSYCEWKLIAPQPDNAAAASAAMITRYLPARREPIESGIVIARGRTAAPAAGASPTTKSSAASVSSTSVMDWHNDGFKLSTGVTHDDSAKVKATAHENQRCLRTCELRFKVKAQGGLFSTSKTVGEAWFPLSYLEIGSPVGSTAKFLVQLEYKKKRTGTLAFELTF